jgi:outer membrane immunogenic protein
MKKPFSFLTVIPVLCLPALAIAGSLSDPTANAPVAYEELSPWQGTYVGATAGYSFGGGDRIGVMPSAGNAFGLGNLDLEGWNGSLRAGYRWQIGKLVMGSEIALEGGGVEDSFTNGAYQASTKLNHALSLRMKAGAVVQIFDSYVYGIVGLTRGEFDYAITGTGGNGALSFDETYATNGYILGVGFERQISDQWTLTGEYEYVNFGSDNLTDGSGNTTKATPLFHTVKLGLNYNF